jgi:hypothetical protein
MNKPFTEAQIVGSLRQAVAGLAVVLLSLPASALIPSAQWNLHVWSRLRQLRRDAPDVGQDRFNRELTPFLPPAGRIGFLNVSTEDPRRPWFFLQYSLAPRTLVPSIEEQFVIEYGAPRGAAGLSRDGRFALVKALGDELRVFRRISR